MKRLLLFHELHATLRRLNATFSRPVRAVARDVDLLQGDAYLVTAHAAVEFYFEELCRRAVYASLWKFQQSRSCNGLMNAVLSSHYFAKVTYLPKNEMTTAASTDLALRDAVVWYTKRVDENQGIKQNNLFSLLLPLGFNENDFDTVWLGSMNSFGSGRGDTAHGRPVANFGRRAIDISPRGSHSSSITVPVWTAKATKTRTTTTPWDVEKTLKDLVPEMKAWDDRLRNGI